MRKILTSIRKLILSAVTVMLLSGSIKIYATTYIVACANFAFTPNVVNAHVGDTVLWQWSGAVVHTTTSGTIPNGAQSWNDTLNTAHPTFIYVAAVVGSYGYDCTIHPSMTGTINVSPRVTTDIPVVESENIVLAYPQPVRSALTVDLTNAPDFKHSANIEIFNAIGELKYDGLMKDVNEPVVQLDLSAFASGVYFLRLSEGFNIKTIRLLKL